MSISHAFTTVTNRFSLIISQNPEFQADLRQLFKALLDDAAAQTADAPVNTESNLAPPDPGQPDDAVPTKSPPPTVEPISPSQHADQPSPLTEIAKPSPCTSPTDHDLSRIESCCRLKADALRWSLERRRLLESNADPVVEVYPFDETMITQAREMGCFLWMSNPSFVTPHNIALIEQAAHCFDVVANVLALVHSLSSDIAIKEFPAALNLLAKAQSALRSAINELDRQPDSSTVRVCLTHSSEGEIKT